MNNQDMTGVPDRQWLQVALRSSPQQVGRWATTRWEVAVATINEPPLADEGGGWVGRLELVLHRNEVDDYRHNLGSDRPQLLVVCSRDAGSEQLEPRALSISQMEAAAHLETDDEVLSCEMPAAILDWIVAYTVLVPFDPERQRRKGAKRQRV